MGEYIETAGYGSNPESGTGEPADPSAKPAADVADASTASIAGVTGVSDDEADARGDAEGGVAGSESAAHPS